MKKILFLIIAVVVSVQVNATRKYVATTGSNAADGSIGTPWQTVAYACTQAVSGDTIMIAAGAYNEGTNLMNKPVGVSIMGVMSGSDTTHIISTNQSTSEYEAAITCKSTTGISTYDNSSISYIKLTGSNLTAFQGIYIGYRSGIKIHNCVIKDFYTSGIGINGSMTSYPNLYLTGIEIYNNVIKNCAGWATLGGVPDANGSSIRIRGTDGIKIHDNLLDNRSRPRGENGETMSLYRNKNHQIYNNTFYRNDHEVTSGGTRRWNFFVEEWNYRGNGQFYNNTLYGLAQFSIGGDDNQIVSGCSYGYKIYNNRFLNTTNGNKFNNGTEVTLFAICVEGGGHNLVEVSRNYIQRYAVGVEISTPTSDPAGYWKESWIMENVKVQYNIIENVGYADNQYGALAIWLINETMVSPYYNTFNNILIANNVLTGDNGGTYRGYAGIYVNINGNWTELNIHNNIATGFSARGIYIYEHSTDGLDLSNSNATYNLMYDNTSSNLVYIESTINQTNVDITTGNLTSDPLFIGGSPYSYALQSTSPAINAGLDVGLSYDYDDKPIYLLPDIGAYEYGTFPASTGLGWEPKYFKENVKDTLNINKGWKIKGETVTASARSLNRVEGATSNIQEQLNHVGEQIGDTIKDRLLNASIGINRADSGLVTSGGYTTGFDWKNGIEEHLIKAAKKFTTVSPVLAHPIMCIAGMVTGQTTMVDGRAQYMLFYIPEPITVTGVRFILQTKGDYTADNYNGAKLYSVTSASTFVRLDSTANNGDFWKGTIVTKNDFAFVGGERLLEPGLYVVGFIWNASATVAAPVMYSGFNNSSATNVMYWGNAGVNQSKLGGYVSTQADLAVNEVFNDLTTDAAGWAIFLY